MGGAGWKYYTVSAVIKRSEIINSNRLRSKVHQLTATISNDDVATLVGMTGA